ARSEQAQRDDADEGRRDRGEDAGEQVEPVRRRPGEGEVGNGPPEECEKQRSGRRLNAERRGPEGVGAGIPPGDGGVGRAPEDRGGEYEHGAGHRPVPRAPAPRGASVAEITSYLHARESPRRAILSTPGVWSPGVSGVTASCGFRVFHDANDSDRRRLWYHGRNSRGTPGDRKIDVSGTSRRAKDPLRRQDRKSTR